METIRMYIENMFGVLPQTSEIIRAKEELLLIMEDKYNELKEQGKSENEAVGVVISEFGNIDEILKELKLEKCDTPIPDETQIIEKGMVLDYLRVVKKNAMMIPIAVFLMIFGVAIFVTINGFSIGDLFTELEAESVKRIEILLGIVLMAIFFIIGIILIIYNSLQLSEFKMVNHKFKLSNEAEWFVKNENQNFSPKKIKLITTGVCICLLSVLLMIVFYAASNGEDDIILFFGVTFMLILIGAGIAPLIYSGMFISAYDKLLQVTETDLKNMKNSERLTGTIAGIYWPMTVAVYLFVSFVWEAWGESWIIWPVAGLIFGAIAVLINMVVRD